MQNILALLYGSIRGLVIFLKPLTFLRKRYIEYCIEDKNLVNFFNLL